MEAAGYVSHVWTGARHGVSLCLDMASGLCRGGQSFCRTVGRGSLLSTRDISAKQKTSAPDAESLVPESFSGQADGEQVSRSSDGRVYVDGLCTDPKTMAWANSAAVQCDPDGAVVRAAYGNVLVARECRVAGIMAWYGLHRPHGGFERDIRTGASSWRVWCRSGLRTADQVSPVL